jgi:hypothetical protein
VHVAGDDEVEGAGRKPVDEGREVDDEDPQVSFVTPHREVGRLRPRARPPRARIGARYIHAPAAQLDRDSFV